MTDAHICNYIIEIELFKNFFYFFSLIEVFWGICKIMNYFSDLSLAYCDPLCFIMTWPYLNTVVSRSNIVFEWKIRFIQKVLFIWNFITNSNLNWREVKSDPINLQYWFDLVMSPFMRYNLWRWLVFDNKAIKNCGFIKQVDSLFSCFLGWINYSFLIVQRNWKLRKNKIVIIL